MFLCLCVCLFVCLLACLYVCLFICLIYFAVVGFCFVFALCTPVVFFFLTQLVLKQYEYQLQSIVLANFSIDRITTNQSDNYYYHWPKIANNSALNHYSKALIKGSNRWKRFRKKNSNKKTCIFRREIVWSTVNIEPFSFGVWNTANFLLFCFMFEAL